jgi:hypothetical protein
MVGEFLTDVIQVVEESQVQDGEICFLLNEGNIMDPVWRQDIGTDQHPMLLSGHSIVIQNADGSYANIMDEDGIESIRNMQLINNNDIYDISGRKIVNRPMKGLYIVNGKKILIK